MSGLSFNNTEVSFRTYSSLKLKQTWILFKIMSYGRLVQLGGFVFEKALSKGLPVSWLVKNNLFAHFCGGETLEECQATLRSLHDSGVSCALHFAVEASQKKEDYDYNTLKTIETLRYKRSLVKNQPYPFSVLKITGVVSSDLLSKIQSEILLSHGDQLAYSEFKQRLDDICKAAEENNSCLLIDAEESWIQDVIDDELLGLMRTYNQKRAVIYTTIQMYRKGRLEYLKDLHQLATQENFFIGVKLVRGAYMEKERQRAKSLNIESPICDTKSETDQQFNSALEFCFHHNEDIFICVGTHNEDSTYHFAHLWLKQTQQESRERSVIAQLFGMSDHLTYNLAFHHIPVCKYLPYAPVEKLIPFLIRRANENSSITGDVSRELQLITKELQRRKKEKHV